MSEWIRCSDELPPDGIRVLLCDNNGWIFTGMREDAVDDTPGYEVVYWRRIADPPDEDRIEVDKIIRDMHIYMIKSMGII